MPLSVKIVADSINPAGKRLTTFEVSTHLFIWSEWMTHRQFSRNAQSNRAIPTKKIIESVRTDPALPLHWGKNQPGMVAEEELTKEQIESVRMYWLQMSREACDHAEKLSEMGGHKQFVNRSLAPYMWIRALISSTTWDNFFNLRIEKSAQPEIRVPAQMMKTALEEHEPQKLEWGHWHLPFVSEEQKYELPISVLKKISAARCARVSFLSHDGSHDPNKDIDLHDRLLADGHMSPFEHVAQANGNLFDHLCANPISNFDPSWFQYRKVIEKEIYAQEK